jgi:hypothetical protein
MLQSQQVLEWQREAEIETRQKSILRVLQLRFCPEVPADLRAKVEAMTDQEELRRWFDAAVLSPSLDKFRVAVQT